MQTETQHIPQEGTISHGTLRYVDLIPVFADEIAKFNPEHDVLVENTNALAISLARVSDDEYLYVKEFQNEYKTVVQEILNEMLDALNELGQPHGLTFGTHEGDGSDFGWWALENQE